MLCVEEVIVYAVTVVLCVCAGVWYVLWCVCSVFVWRGVGFV